MEVLKIIRENIFYIQQFRDSLFVVRLGEKIIGHAEELGILRDICLLRDMGIKVVISHSTQHLKVDGWISIKDEIYQQDFSKLQDIRIALKSDLIPVVFCSSSNCSTERLVCEISVKLSAKKIIFITHYDGIYGEDRRLIPELTAEEAEKLLNKKNVLNGRAREKVVAAIIACREKIPRIHIINGNRDGSLLKEVFSCEGVGTMIYTKLPYQSMRIAKEKDIPGIINILRNSKFERSLKDTAHIEATDHLKNFSVFTVDDQVHGCAMITSEKELPLMTIDYLAVSPTYEDSGVIEKMVETLLDDAKKKDVAYVVMNREKNLIWLGMYPWFLGLGFKKSNTSELNWHREKEKSKNVWIKYVKEE